MRPLYIQRCLARPIHDEDEHSRNSRAGNIFNLQDFERNKIKVKQRNLEDFIGTSLVLIDADLLPIFVASFPLPSYIVPGLACHANNFARGVYLKSKSFNKI